MPITRREREDRRHPRLGVMMPGYRLTCEDGSVLFQWFHPHGVLPVTVLKEVK